MALAMPSIPAEVTGYGGAMKFQAVHYRDTLAINKQ